MAHGLKIQHGLESIIRGWSFKRHKSLFSGSTNCKQLLLYSRVVYLSGNPVSIDLNGNWIHATINCLFPLSLLIWEWITTMETQPSCRAIRICTSPSCLPAVNCFVGPRPEVFAQKGGARGRKVFALAWHKGTAWNTSQNWYLVTVNSPTGP